MSMFHALVGWQGVGLELAGGRLAAVSHADDVAAMSPLLEELHVLIGCFFPILLGGRLEGECDQDTRLV